MAVLLSSFPRPACAVVIGSSGGLGRAFVDLLRQDGLDVIGMSRSGLSDHRIDIADEASISAAALRVGESGPVQVVLVATGLLHDANLRPEKSYRHLDPDDLARAFRINAIGPAPVAKHFLPLLPKTGRSVFAVLSARVGSIADNRLGGWYGYRASKAALNQFVRTSAIELARQKPDALCVALHPGTVDTGLSAPFQTGVKDGKLFTPEVSARHLLQVLDGLKPADTGGLFAWDGARIPF